MDAKVNRRQQTVSCLTDILAEPLKQQLLLIWLLLACSKWCKLSSSSKVQLREMQCNALDDPFKVSSMAPDMELAIRRTGQLLPPSENDKLLVEKRRNREAHHHKQIWTKDAHGGPYRKVQADLLITMRRNISKLLRAGGYDARAARQAHGPSHRPRARLRETAERAHHQLCGQPHDAGQIKRIKPVWSVTVYDIGSGT